VAGDFLVRQGLGTVVDPHRYFVPDDDWEEGSAVPFIHPHAQLHARLLQQACCCARRSLLYIREEVNQGRRVAVPRAVLIYCA
jgi:hypothetical protein